ncbi:hypothetical protein FRB90_008096, partial [Tulasnella sp. 427]
MSTSSSGPTDPSSSTSASAPVQAPPKNTPRNPPKLSVQAAVPPVMQVSVPQSVDVPFRSCFIWRQWTPRTESMKQEIHSTLCWRKIAPERETLSPQFPIAIMQPTPTLVIGDLPATQSQRVPARRPPMERQESSTEAAPTEPPKELFLLKARMIEYHSHSGTMMRPPRHPVTLR